MNGVLFIKAIGIVNLLVRYRPEDLVLAHRGIAIIALKLLLALEVGIHCLYDGAPAYKVEPALAFHGKLQTTLHAYSLASILLIRE